MRKALAVLFLALSAPLFAQTAITGSGGTLVAPTQVGQNITISNVQLSGGGYAAVICTVDSFGAGTYQWNWTCSKGTLYVNNFVVSSVWGTMKLTCSGGGRYHPTVCYHVFSGDTPNGPITATSKGGTNNATSTVTSFSATY